MPRNSQNPSTRMPDRHQIDYMHGSNTLSHRASLTATESGAATSDSLDNLGPLPSGWQMSKNELGRMFFINHLQKRTTWVKKTIDEFHR